MDGVGQVLKAARKLVGLASDEEADSVVLAAQFGIEVVLELAQLGILVTGDCNGPDALPFSRVGLDVVLQAVIVDIVYLGVGGNGSVRLRRPKVLVRVCAEAAASEARRRNCSKRHLRRLHSGTDSCSNCSPYFMLWSPRHAWASIDARGGGGVRREETTWLVRKPRGSDVTMGDGVGFRRAAHG